MSNLGHSSPEVGVAARIAAGAVALGGLGAGGAATFETDNEVGTAALLLVGVFAGIIALLGRVPRIKWGENEFDASVVAARATEAATDAVTNAVEAAAEDADAKPEDLVDAARAAARTATGRAWVSRHLDSLGPFVVQQDAKGNYHFVRHDEEGRVLSSTPFTRVETEDQPDKP